MVHPMVRQKGRRHMNRYIAFLKVLDLNSITKAAQTLGYTQSAVSQMIQSLEKELQLNLIRRSRNGVVLTEEGKKLLPYIERAVNEYHRLLEIDKEILGLEDGLIRIGTLSSYSSQWLPRIIKEFQELYPRVRFRLRQGDYTTVPEYIRQGSVDFGFVSPDAETVKGLETIFITEGSHSAILPAGHRLAKRKRIDLKELASEPYIQLETGCLSEPIEMFHKLGLEPEIELRMHDNFSVCTMVEAGIGVSIMPDLALRKMAFSIVAIPTRPDIKRKVAFAMKEKKALPVASRRFLDFFMARFSELN